MRLCSGLGAAGLARASAGVAVVLVASRDCETVGKTPGKEAQPNRSATTKGKA